MYGTPDWDAARQSLRHLADYAPNVAITGHGPPARGERLRMELSQLAAHFDEWARPAHGRYRDRPAITNADGVVDVPPPIVSGRTVAIAGLAIGVAVGFAYAMRQRDHRLADRAPTADDVSLRLSSDLALADGGYDASAVAAPTTIELR
jgi:hypothetical protein